MKTLVSEHKGEEVIFGNEENQSVYQGESGEHYVFLEDLKELRVGGGTILFQQGHIVRNGVPSAHGLVLGFKMSKPYSTPSGDKAIRVRRLGHLERIKYRDKLAKAIEGPVNYWPS